MKIIVADKISERGLALLRETSWEIKIHDGLPFRRPFTARNLLQ